VGEGEKKGEAGCCELLGHGLLRGPRREGAGPQARERESRLAGPRGLRAEKKRKGEMGWVRKKREGEKGGFGFSSFYFFQTPF
jgi:hypothetical protein